MLVRVHAAGTAALVRQRRRGLGRIHGAIMAADFAHGRPLGQHGQGRWTKQAEFGYAIHDLAVEMVSTSSIS
jgi:hypothetical protein